MLGLSGKFADSLSELEARLSAAGPPGQDLLSVESLHRLLHQARLPALKLAEASLPQDLPLLYLGLHQAGVGPGEVGGDGLAELGVRQVGGDTLGLAPSHYTMKLN